MPPATLEAFRVNEVPWLAPSDTTPAKESLIFTVPPVALALSVLALREPAEAKSMLFVPALRLTVVALRAPVAFSPPAAFEALRVNDVPELAPSETSPAN